jgi:hypothetical protein
VKHARPSGVGRFEHAFGAEPLEQRSAAYHRAAAARARNFRAEATTAWTKEHLEGEIARHETRVRLWNRALAASEISVLYATDIVPKEGLVGEFLLNVNTGTTAVDTAQENNGNIFNATWATQE